MAGDYTPGQDLPPSGLSYRQTEHRQRFARACERVADAMFDEHHPGSRFA